MTNLAIKIYEHSIYGVYTEYMGIPLVYRVYPLVVTILSISIANDKTACIGIGAKKIWPHTVSTKHWFYPKKSNSFRNSTQRRFLQPSGHVGHIIQPLLTADHKVHVDLARTRHVPSPEGTTIKAITGNHSQNGTDSSDKYDLRCRGKGRKGRNLAWELGFFLTKWCWGWGSCWKSATELAASGDLPTVSPRQNCLWTSQSAGREGSYGSKNMRFHPPNTLPTQEGLLAEMSLCDNTLQHLPCNIPGKKEITHDRPWTS